MPIHQSLLAFNSGEISPYLLYRSDFAKIPSAAEKMRNFLPLPFGSVSKRPGTVWLAQTVAGGLNSKAFPFTTSDGVDYVLQFTQEILTVYRKDGTVAATVPFLEDYTFPDDPHHENSIRGIQMVQVNDVAFFTHPVFHPLRLTSVSDTAWTLEFLPFERAPVLDENTDETKTYTVASNPVAATWASGAGYVPGNVRFTNCEWYCIKNHTASAANKPGVGASWMTCWRRMLYSAGDEITLISDERSEVAWGLQYRSYLGGAVSLSAAGGRPMSVSTAFYICVVDHTVDATYTGSLINDHVGPDGRWTAPLATGQTWAWVFEWINALSSGGYVLGDLVFTAGAIYKCIAAHAASGGGPGIFEPGVTPGWGTYWELIAASYGAPSALVVSDSYAIGNRVSYAGAVYECNTAHTPDNSNRPGVGAQWTLISDVWSSSFASSERSPGKYYRISPKRDDADFQVSLAATSANNGQKTAEIVVQGAWNFFTFGTWTGTFSLERSINNGKTWEVVRSYQSTADRNVSDAGTEAQPTLMRIGWAHGANGSSSPRALLVPETNYVTGFCLMDTYVSNAFMTGIAKTAMLSGNTYQWSQGAFDSVHGFPRALTLHGYRLWLASTVLNPVSIWGSKINSFLDFDPQTDDDAGLFRTLAASNHLPIRWLHSSRRLFVGTAGGEWVEGSEASDAPITPTNIQFREYTPIGSISHQPVRVHDGVFFLGRQGGRVYELGASDTANDTFAAADMSRMAEHLTAPGVIGMSFQRTREPCLWLITQEGNLLSFNYSRTEQINAWAMHSTQGGQFRDVVIFPSDDGDDEVFFVVDRDGGQLERFPAGWQALQESGTIGNYLDAAGMEGGDLPVTSELRIPPQDMQVDGGGTQGRRKRANEILLNVFQSLGGAISYDGQTVDFNWSSGSDLMDAPLPLKTQWIAITLPPAHMDDLQFSIMHSNPYPFTVRAGVLRWSLHEP